MELELVMALEEELAQQSVQVLARPLEVTLLLVEEVWAPQLAQL